MNSQYISKLNNSNEFAQNHGEDVYKNPMPLDMINKFVGLDSRILHHDDVVQKQAFDQSYKNFWSFVDFNLKFNDENSNEQAGCSHQGMSKSVTPASSMTVGTKCSGVKMTYLEARDRANQL